ncbi:Succinate-semialdehyde dehydrogenase, mitochondrial [Vitis vinifera]|uniref:Succinate-semialdehyde dehydrogenase, mitochondrial n=1 Tax=Vitis vinifera TaxID=29760 RepID=A0A438IAT1_VITVI|nr:Succinate-semialdehyde dehydrogenase, mitochondrial [Vitis vinifera]
MLKFLFYISGIYEKFATAFSKAVTSLQVGDGFCEGVTQGPLINEAAVQTVESLVQDAISKVPTDRKNQWLKLQAKSWCLQENSVGLLGKKVAKAVEVCRFFFLKENVGVRWEPPSDGWNILEASRGVKRPLALSKVRNKICGPIAALLRFKTEEEAICIANDTDEGLAAYIFTKNLQRSWRVSEVLEYGLVGVSEGLIPTVMAPVSGFKNTGLGQEGSKKGMLEYLEVITRERVRNKWFCTIWMVLVLKLKL